MIMDDHAHKLLRAQLSHYEHKISHNFDRYKDLLLLHFELLAMLEGNPLFTDHLEKAYALICTLR